MQDLIRQIVEALVDDIDAIKIHTVETDTTRVIEVEVARCDVGKLIGKSGKTADALRAIVAAASGKERKRTILNIVD